MDESKIAIQNVKWSGLFLSRLRQNGVQHIVISPGSRSTPLVLAASLVNDFTIHTLIDERSAGYFALGLAKQSGIPPVLICTSGTAPAHYYPAVIEASITNTPLIVLSADRPPRLRGVFAPQSIDQIKLYGSYPIAFQDVVNKHTDESSYSLTLDLADNIFCNARYKHGPVHVNIPFSKPLEPKNEADTLSILAESKQLATGYPPKRLVHHSDFSDLSWFDNLVSRLNKSERPILIPGPTTIQNGSETMITKWLVEQTNIPVLAESVSGIRHFSNENVIKSYEGILKGNHTGLGKPDFIIRIGIPPVSKGLNQYLKQNKDVEQWCISHQHIKPDPNFSADTFIRLPYELNDVPETSVVLINDYNHWLSDWKNLEKSLAEATNHLFSISKGFLTDGEISHFAGNYFGKNWNLFVSNSFPVRDIDLFSTAFRFSKVWHNRGASGIDGITSTAHGIATSGKKPLVLLTGDLAFLHDTNALLNLSTHNGEKIIIYVVNNNGGNIFKMLPIAAYESVYTPLFETPQTVDFDKLCTAYGIDAHSIKTINELETSTKAFISSDSKVLILNCITDPAASMNERKQLWSLFRKS